MLFPYQGVPSVASSRHGKITCWLHDDRSFENGFKTPVERLDSDVCECLAVTMEEGVAKSAQQ